MRYLLVLSTLAALSCGSDSASGPVTPASVAGTWKLETVNGQKLPWSHSTGVPYNITFGYISETLVLENPAGLGENGRCELRSTVYYEGQLLNPPRIDVSGTERCEWALSGEAQTDFRWFSETASYDAQGTVTHNTLTLNWFRHPHDLAGIGVGVEVTVYRKQ